MRRAVPIFAVLVMQCAHAGIYTQAVQTQEACTAVGKMGVIAYRARSAGVSTMSGAQRQDAADAWLAKVDALQPIPGGVKGRIIRKAVDHAFTAAPSAQDAFEYGWAECMDVYGPQ